MEMMSLQFCCTTTCNDVIIMEYIIWTIVKMVYNLPSTLVIRSLLLDIPLARNISSSKLPPTLVWGSIFTSLLCLYIYIYIYIQKWFTCLAVLGNYTAGINLIHAINNQVAIIHFSSTKEYNYNLLDWSISNGIAMPM